MELKKLLSFVEHQNKFKEWKGKNPTAELVHVFTIFEEGKTRQFDVGYYTQKTKKMASFTVTEGSKDIMTRDAEEVLKDPDHKVLFLAVDDVVVELDDALYSAVKLQKQKYPKDEAIKYVMILQRLALGQVWNITFVTKQFKTLNVKVDAKTGKVVEDSLQSLFQFGA